MEDAGSFSVLKPCSPDEKRAHRVEEIVKRACDQIGDRVVDVFSSNKPYYAIYRTSTRLVVQYADDDVWVEGARLADLQRTRLSPLAPLRGQINGLIDGWHSTALRKPEDEGGEGVAAGLRDWIGQFLPSKQRQARRAFYYDRRVADALIVLLDDPGALETSQTLLTQIKNDIITERTSIARSSYLRWALGLATLLILLCAFLSSEAVMRWGWFQPEVTRAWSAVAGGAAGAFFSLVLGLKQRNLTIDLQNRENIVDVVVRMLIGAIAGGIFYTLVMTKVVSTNVFQIHLPLTGTWGDLQLSVYLMGFVAGFLERLVPNLLNATNFAKTEPVPAEGTPLSPTAKTPPPGEPSPAALASVASAEAGEACLCDGAPMDGEATTPDHELPAAEGGVADDGDPAPSGAGDGDPQAPDQPDPATPEAGKGQG